MKFDYKSRRMETNFHQLTDNEVIEQFMAGVLAKRLPRYDSDWKELIPVWYKFKEINIEDRRKNVVFERFYDRIKDAILHQGPSPSEACKLLAEGIRWYNSVKK